MVLRALFPVYHVTCRERDTYRDRRIERGLASKGSHFPCHPSTTHLQCNQNPQALASCPVPNTEPCMIHDTTNDANPIPRNSSRTKGPPSVNRYGISARLRLARLCSVYAWLCCSALCAYSVRAVRYRGAVRSATTVSQRTHKRARASFFSPYLSRSTPRGKGDPGVHTRTYSVPVRTGPES